MAIKILHFADAHIDMLNFGRVDKDSGLPLRVADFLRSLDAIVDFAISEPVDLVLFAGDAYRNQRPHPKFQRQWQRRIMRLAAAGIPTVLLVGNHDTSPSAQSANAMQEFSTLSVQNVHVAHRFGRLGPEELGVDIQVVTLPWFSASVLAAARGLKESGQEERLSLEELVIGALENYIGAADPELPLVLLGHVTVEGATWGSERQVMLGRDIRIPRSVVKDPRLDYVALGHIHKHQSLGDGHPPVVYAGSIERVDFGELKESKGFVVAEVSRGRTKWRFVPLQTRRYLDISVVLQSADTFMRDIVGEVARYEDQIADAVCRLQLFYPRKWESLLNESEVAGLFDKALTLQITKQRSDERRSRLGDSLSAETMSPPELLQKYWKTIDLDPAEVEAMQRLAQEVFGDDPTA